MNIVAVIPARNEAQTVADVVRTALSHPLISRVVVSDSASSDDTATIARDAGAEVIQVNIPGKGEAMAAAISQITDATHYLFLDADLLGLTTEGISKIMNLIPNAQMGIGIQDRGWFWNLLARNVLPRISGQRIIPKELWDAVPIELKTGYRIELALNFVANKLRMHTLVCTLDGVSALLQEEKKSGVVSGLRGRTRLTKEVFTTFFILRLLYWTDFREDIKAHSKARV